jgi:hypothetical protein
MSRPRGYLITELLITCAGKFSRRAGQDGHPRSDGKEQVSCNMASKVKHLAWHPAENFIICAANSSLYMYHT